MIQLQTNLLFFLLIASVATFGQSSKHANYLLICTDTTKEEYGYKNQNGNIVIQPGKYSFCYTDTFRTYAIVAHRRLGLVGINRQQNVLYKVFPYDNGPDYAADSLFRIIVNSKIGYADEVTGKVVIKPQFACAFPFENGSAKVSLYCTAQSDGEHSYWKSNVWFYINKKGEKIKPPMVKK